MNPTGTEAAVSAAPAVTEPRARRRRKRSRRSVGDRIVLYVLALLSAIILIGPLLWMLSSSLKSPSEVLANPPTLLPHEWRFQNYVDVFHQVPFGRYLFNSFFVATTVTVVALLFHSMAAYSLARLKFPGRDKIFLGMLMTLMVPFTVIAVPLFIIVNWLGWVDTYQGLIIPMIPHAFGIFLLRQFYLSIPRELEEAAIVDGASLPRVYWSIILPLSRPVLAALGVFFFLANWNNFLWPLIVTQNQKLWVVQLGIQQFRGEHGSDYNLIMAASTCAALPTLILFFVLQKRLVEGIKMTGLKG
jgi:multiple sugar transport system permease protein